MLVNATFGTSTSAAAVTPVPQPFAPQAQTVEQYVRSYFADIPVMIDIARCESKFRQFSADGGVKHGDIVYSDLGVMQINSYYHQTEAANMGLDLTTIEGNVAFARYLYDK